MGKAARNKASRVKRLFQRFAGLFWCCCPCLRRKAKKEGLDIPYEQATILEEVVKYAEKNVEDVSTTKKKEIVKNPVKTTSDLDRKDVFARTKNPTDAAGDSVSGSKVVVPAISAIQEDTASVQEEKASIGAKEEDSTSDAEVVVSAISTVQEENASSEGKEEGTCSLSEAAVPAISTIQEDAASIQEEGKEVGNCSLSEALVPAISTIQDDTSTISEKTASLGATQKVLGVVDTSKPNLESEDFLMQLHATNVVHCAFAGAFDKLGDDFALVEDHGVSVQSGPKALDYVPASTVPNEVVPFDENFYLTLYANHLVFTALYNAVTWYAEEIGVDLY